MEIKCYNYFIFGKDEMALSEEEAKLNPANRDKLYYQFMYKSTKTKEEINECINDILPPIEKIHVTLHHLYGLYAIERHYNKLTMQHNGIEWKISMYGDGVTVYVHASFFGYDRKFVNNNDKELNPDLGETE